MQAARAGSEGLDKGNNVTRVQRAAKWAEKSFK
jgi:hypothetical protein